MEFIRVNNDINGNPRYVFHYLDFLTEQGRADNTVSQGYNEAVYKAKQIGGKRYRGSEFGGGIVIQSYNIQKTMEQIRELAK